MLNIQEVTYTVVLLNGSIADKNVRTIAQLKGVDATKTQKTDKVFKNIEAAREYRKIRNRQLSPGEKKYYGMKYAVVGIKDNKFTGKAK